MDYQLDYAAKTPQMYSKISREQKAKRIIKTLEFFYQPLPLKNFTVLDIGSSTGIIDNYLAKKVKKIVGIDIDKEAVMYAQQNFKAKNLEFKKSDAMNLPFKASSFDIVICTHIYEHVPDSKQLFHEIYRVLKPKGTCYLTAVNKLWIIEPHYKLFLLSWLPKGVANLYVRITKKADRYFENPRTCWGLKLLTKKFQVHEYTSLSLRQPEILGYDDIIKPHTLFANLAWFLSPLAKFLSPTFIWILQKPE